MANINVEIAAIEAASRGEAVRDAIVNALLAINTEGPGTMAWANITDTPTTISGYGIEAVPAAMIDGVLSLSNIPPAAVERVVPVADDTARFALTGDQVQNGDTVRVLDTQKLYLVVDDTNLDTEAGYLEYTAGSADAVDWSGVLNTPDTLAGYGIEDAYTSDQVDDLLSSDESESAEGNPVAVETESAQLATRTHLTFAPQQDLHGYDHPWPAGGGKNLLPMTVDGIKAANTSGTWSGNVYTVNGVTFTVQTDSDGNVTGINANGTAGTSGAFLYITRDFSTTAEVIMNGTPSGSSTTYFIQAYKSGGADYRDYGSGVTISSGENFGVLLFIKANVTVTNITFTPMFRLATESDPTFEPYSNICPISGLDTAEVERFGDDNIFDGTKLPGYINVSGIIVSSDTFCRTDFLPVKGGQLVRVTGVSKYSAAGNTKRLHCYDINKNWIQQVDYKLLVPFDDEYEVSGIVPDNARYIAFSFYINDVDVVIKLSDVISCPLPETVYGGTLDMETGELVVDRASVDLGTLTWTYTSAINVPYFRSSVLSGGLAIANGQTNALCSSYAKYTGSQAGFIAADKVVWTAPTNVSSYPYACIRDTAYTDADTFKTAMSGVQLVYELATPRHYTLTPKQLALLKGVNHISTNASTVKVTFRAGQLATLSDVAGAVEIADEHLETALSPILGDFADIETSPSASNHAVDEYLIYDSKLYKVIAAITAGESLAEGTNIQRTTVMAELIALTQ